MRPHFSNDSVQNFQPRRHQNFTKNTKTWTCDSVRAKVGQILFMREIEPAFGNGLHFEHSDHFGKLRLKILLNSIEVHIPRRLNYSSNRNSTRHCLSQKLATWIYFFRVCCSHGFVERVVDRRYNEGPRRQQRSHQWLLCTYRCRHMRMSILKEPAANDIHRRRDGKASHGILG